jgi:hypothetical protein
MPTVSTVSILFEMSLDGSLEIISALILLFFKERVGVGCSQAEIVGDRR